MSSEDQVYVIGAAGSSIAKVGVSNDPARRLKQIQAMSPVRLVLLWTCPGSYDLEGLLHAYLQSYRSHGEWFDFGNLDRVQSVQDAVAKIQSGSSGTDVTADQQTTLAPSSACDTTVTLCICGHESEIHGASGCTFLGYDDSRDCRCSQYVLAPVIDAVDA